MMERIAALGADYVSTIAALVRTEAEEDAARVARVARSGGIGVVLLAIGVAWLNVALLLWLLTTPDPIAGALAVGVVALVVGATLVATARRRAASIHPLEATRRVLADELGGRDPALVHPPPAPMRPAEASTRLREIRAELRETVALQREPADAADPASTGPAFEPRSRTMRTAMWLWRAIPRVPAGAAMMSALGVLAVGSPRLRRLVTVLALLRNLGGQVRSSAPVSYRSP